MKIKIKRNVEKAANSARNLTNELLSDPKIKEVKSVFKEKAKEAKLVFKEKAKEAKSALKEKAKEVVKEIDDVLGNKIEEFLIETKGIVLKSIAEVANKASSKITEILKNDKAHHHKKE